VLLLYYANYYMYFHHQSGNKEILITSYMYLNVLFERRNIEQQNNEVHLFKNATVAA